LLSSLSGGLATLGVALVLLAYKLPYDPIWWFALGAFVLGAFILPPLLAPAIEWVMRGYAEDGGS
jgi:hypothetical protein